MDLYVLFAQRKETHPGEYGPEALACMTEYEYDDNPEYLDGEKTKADEGGDFERSEIIRLSVDQKAIMRILRPAAVSIPAAVSEISMRNPVKGTAMAKVFVLLLLSPFWLAHYVCRKWLLRDQSWTMQKSVDLIWASDHRLGEAQRNIDFFDREIALEKERLALPKPLYLADLDLHYGRVQQAREKVERYMVEHPGDDKALQILAKIEGRA